MLARLLKVYRSKTGKSLSEIGRLASISTSYLSDAENGRRPLTADRLKKLATIYADGGCTFEELWAARPVDRRTKDAISFERARVARVLRNTRSTHRRWITVTRAVDEIASALGIKIDL